jgi:voltage-gated potassium channel
LDLERHAIHSTIHSYGDALWWAVVTIATVGYGDKYPVSGPGRGIAVLLMISGIALFGVLTATLASYFAKSDVDAAEAQLSEVNARLERIEAALGRLPPESLEVAREGS